MVKKSHEHECNRCDRITICLRKHCQITFTASEILCDLCKRRQLIAQNKKRIREMAKTAGKN